MKSQSPVRVFVGSGEASLLERKTLISSIKKHTRRDLDIYVFNGTHNAIERNTCAPVPAPLSLDVKYRNVTEFSNYRFVIPQICNYSGRAIWLDSDMICLHDIGDLFDAPMGDNSFLAKAEAYRGEGKWGLSVMLIDCERSRFDIDRYFQEVDKGLYTSGDLHQMTEPFLARHRFKIGQIDPNWNVFDRYDRTTKLIHYTNLLSQPWKFPGHPYGDLWFQYFREAQRSGEISSRDVELSQSRGYVRQDILEGNQPSMLRAMFKFSAHKRRLKNWWLRQRNHLNGLASPNRRWVPSGAEASET